jgi:hypothetical protein
VTDATWEAAWRAGWIDQQLTDALAYLVLTVFTGYFLNYAQTDMDALRSFGRSECQCRNNRSRPLGQTDSKVG